MTRQPTEPAAHHSPHRPRLRRWTTVPATVLIALACLSASAINPTPNPPRPHTTGLTAAITRPPPTAAGPTPTPATEPAAPTPITAVGNIRPLALRIPAIGVSVRLISLGLNPDGTVEVPTDYQQAGWFQHGPTPGDTGSAVVLGHVDSHEGPAVFFRLHTLRPGDQVEIVLTNNATVHFVVTHLATYPKEEFPGQDVYGSHGYSALQLVTCGGVFDTNLRSYRSNVVVYTRLISP